MRIVRTRGIVFAIIGDEIDIRVYGLIEELLICRDKVDKKSVNPIEVLNLIKQSYGLL